MRAGGIGAIGASLLGSGTLAGCRADPVPRVLPGRPVSAGTTMSVVLVILDSLRKDHVAAYGNDRIQPPTLDTVAREGLRFTGSHPDAMATLPARRAIHTGGWSRAWSG